MTYAANLILITKFKWAKVCSGCGKKIPEGAPGYWDKEGKKYYHIQAGCLPANANPKGAITPPILTKAEESQTPPMKPLPRLTPELQAKWLKEIERAFKLIGEEPDLNDRLEAEMMRQYFSEWMADRIQTQKEENMNRITRERDKAVRGIFAGVAKPLVRP